ncbi:exodeoxyribonuclease V beta chain [Vibrio variabilis]|uniref:Exodeoxyribonuclease V beta chain n=1 Tax=Vibrio variabilis TaxID=990271 RepID=A0ABQ0JMU6_9VIBR|nr:exodeoxyribonuclease V beta chain [Vibrio variabilis]
MFEEIEFTEPAGSEGNSQIIAELLEKEQYDPEWLPVLIELVDQVMNTALDGDALFLRDKGIDKRLVEMEFLLPIDVLDAPSSTESSKGMIACQQELMSLASTP